MKHIGKVVVVAVTLISASCKTSPPAELTANCGDDVIASQNRINRYFHKAVVPKMSACWSRIQGEGTIDFQFTYKRTAGGWEWEKLGVSGSTLPKGQDAVALQCMQESVRGTSFPVEEVDGKAVEFFADWRWPVPWPKDITEMARMAGNGIIWGECGLGKLKKCQDCLYDAKTKKLSCKSTCSGYTNCTPNADGNGCMLGPISPRCVSGFSFGNSGGIVIY